MIAKDTLERFCDAFARKNSISLSGLFAPTGQFEFPLADQRLVGRKEIETGAKRMFEVLEFAVFTLTKVKALSNCAIAEGKLDTKRIGASQSTAFPLAIVVSTEDAGATRISVYLDAYQQRPWLDGRVFAAG